MSELPADLRTPKCVARLLGVSVSTVRRWLREGRLRGYRIGGRCRISEAVARALVVPVRGEGK